MAVSSTKAAPITRLWAASDVVALDVPLASAWWCGYRAGPEPPVSGGFSAVGEDAVGLRGQELLPRRAGAPGCGADPGVMEDLPHR
jgi:hypothetical protein